MSKDGFDWLGEQLAGRYTVQKQLGAGGMGKVFLAHDQNLNTEVVVKVPHQSMLDDAEFVKRFQHEVRSLVTLTHPHVVKVMDVGNHEGVPFAVMHYLPGGDLKDRQPVALDGRPAPHDPASLAGWLPDVAKALDFIHSQGYVHRDIKPDNILFDASGNAYVGDFGIAKALGTNVKRAASGRLTQKGVALGTPEYMAPEVVLGENYDGRADQYALAATVFEVLCGRPPFQGHSAMAIIVQATTKIPPRPSTLASAVFGHAEICLLKGLSRKPADRHPNCTVFASELVRLLGENASSKPATAAAASEAKRHRGAGDPAAMLPTGRYEAELSDTALRTPPPPGGAARNAECPGCRNRIPILTPNAETVTCPKCGKRFPNPALAVPKDVQRDTPRPTETVRHEPPPIPPRRKTQSSQGHPTSPVKLPRGNAGPFGPVDPSASAEDSIVPLGKSDAKPEGTRAAIPKSTPKRSGDVEPPTVLPGSMELQRPAATSPSVPVPKPVPPKADPKPPVAARPKPLPTQQQPARSTTPKPDPAPPAKPLMPRKPEPVRKVESAQPVRARSVSPSRRPASNKPRVSNSRIVGLILKLFAVLLMIGGTSWLVVWLLSNRAVIVARDGSGHYETISEALEKVKPGGRIEIRKGTYTEDRLVIDKPVTIAGVDQDKVTINVKGVVILKHSEASLSDVTVHGMRAAAPNAAKKAARTSPRRRFLPVLPAAMLLQGALNKGGGAEARVQIFAAIDKRQKASRCAIRVTDGKPSIRNCTVTSEDGVGIVVEGTGSRPTIRDCRVRDCRGAGLYCMNGGSAIVEECRFESNGFAGIAIRGGDAEIRKCRIKDTRAVGKDSSYGILVIEGTPVIDGCEIENVATGIAIWEKADANIRGCKIAKGRQTGLVVLGKVGVTGDTEISQFKTGVGVGSKAHADLRDCRVHDNQGHGILIVGSARLERCSVYGQKGIDKDPKTGRGIEVSSKTGNAVISDTKVYGNRRFGLAIFGKARIQNRSEVYNNKVDGVLVQTTGHLTAENSKFYGATKFGLLCYGKLEMTKCEVLRNGHGGLDIEDDGKATLRDVDVAANKGSGIRVHGTGKIENCRITGNDYSGVFVGSGNAEITGCRIQSNKFYGVYVGSRSVKNLTKYGAATVTGGDLTKNGKGSTTTSNSRASLTVNGSVKTDSGAAKP